MEVTQEDLQSPQQRNSSEAPRERLYSLRIQNTTSCNSGTYRCTLVGQEGQRNLTGTVILKVTGEVVYNTCFLPAAHRALSVSPDLDPLNPSLIQKLWITSAAES